MSQVSPHDHEAEQVVLGGLFRFNDLQDDIFPRLKPASFYGRAHSDIYSAMQTLGARGAPLDYLSVTDELGNKIDSVGGPVYLVELGKFPHSRASVLYQVKKVRELAKRRYIVDQGHKLLSIGTDPTLSSADAEAMAVKLMDQLGNIVSEVRDQGMSEIVASHINTLIKQAEGNEPDMIVPTIYPALNRHITGFAPGEVIVLAGRPGTGKTALALNLITGAAVDGYPAGIVSLEMVRGLLLNRLLSTGAHVQAQKFREGGFVEQDWVNIQNYAQTLSTAPLRLADQPTMTPAELRAILRAWKRQTGLRVAAVDYLQLLKPQDRRSLREQQVAEASRIIKNVAVELEISVLLLAQLNREAEKTKKPLMSQLRESGAIEQDADIILFILPWQSESEVVPVKVDVAKGRNNACGSLKLMYRSNYLQFVSANEGQQYHG